MDAAQGYDNDDFTVSIAGVEANGVGICLEETGWEENRRLRDLLHGADVSLGGGWRCGAVGDVPRKYQGDLETFFEDVGTVQDVLDTPDAAGLDPVANFATPETAGAITGSWRGFSPALAATVTHIRREADVTSVNVQEKTLHVDIAPTRRLADLQEAAARIAGPGLSVHVTMEQSPLLNEEEQLAAADLSDAVRAVPGVLSVMPGLSAAAGPATLEVTVENTTALRRAVHAAHGHEALQALRLQVTVPRDTVSDPTDYFTMDPATPDADTELFTSLLAHPQTESLSVRISAQAVDVQLRVHGRPADSAQALKSVVPEGAEVRVTSVESMLSFIASDRLRVDQVETVVDTAAADEFVEAWNADD